MARKPAKIFLSYASERKALAEPIALALRSRGYDVFFDRDDLLPGATYHDQIDRSIAAADILIFGISPESVDKGRYTLTEIKLARRKWRTPQGHVLPVMLAPTPIDHVPAYLREVSFLEPEGNLVAEVAAEVGALMQGIERRRRYSTGQRIQRIAWIGGGIGLAAGAAVISAPFVWRAIDGPSAPSEIAATQTPPEATDTLSVTTSPTPSEAAPSGPVTPPPVAPTAPSIDPRDDAAWKKALATTDFNEGIAAAQAYLRAWPNGAFRTDADARILALREQIRGVQRLLADLGAPISADGVAGKGTEEALYRLACTDQYEWDGRLTEALARDLKDLADGGSGPMIGRSAPLFSRQPPAGPALGSRADFAANVNDRVYFDFCDEALDDVDRRSLDAQAAWLKAYPGARVQVQGHAEEREGSREYALALGAARADAVRTYLVSRGVSPDRIETVSFGKDRPVAGGSDESSWARNRNTYTNVVVDQR